MESEKTCSPHLEAAMNILGKKWTALILWSLMEGTHRFSEMSSYVPGLSDRLLSQRLQELEEVGMVKRRVYGGRPVLVEYTLTEKGHALRPVMEAIYQWGEQWEASAGVDKVKAAT
jgi:DNA-binding HxlR family transcriptional regulator